MLFCGFWGWAAVLNCCLMCAGLLCLLEWFAVGLRVYCMFGLADNDCERSEVCLIGFVLICFLVVVG